MFEIKAIILAAGYATRLYPLTLNMPKALLEIAGKPIIGYIVDELNTIERVSQIYVVTNSKFYSHFCDWARQIPTPVEVVDDGTSTEETRRGAIGDILFTLEKFAIDDDVMIIAGDNFFTYRLADYYSLFHKNPADYVLVQQLNDYEQLKHFAVARLDADDRITELVEKPEKPQTNIAVYATYIYHRETLPLFRQYIDEGNKKDAPGYFVQWLYKRKPVYAWRAPGECYDIGTQAAYDEVRAKFEQ